MRKKAPSYMSTADFKAALKTIGLSGRTSSAFLRVNLSTIKRYGNGQMPIPWAPATLLTIMIKLKLKPAHVERLTGMGNPTHDKK